MEQFFPDMDFPDAERAYGTVLRHAKRACFRWIPGALKCFKGAGEPHRTPALMAGIDTVPCASAARRPPGSLLAWNNFSALWDSRAPSGHALTRVGSTQVDARAIAYGEQVLDYSGPMYRQTTREGPALRLWFDDAGSSRSKQWRVLPRTKEDGLPASQNPGARRYTGVADSEADRAFVIERAWKLYEQLPKGQRISSNPE